MKVAVVTGGNRGIGKAIVLALARNGFTVVIGYNVHREEALNLENLIKNEMKMEACSLKCDVSSEAEINQFVERIINKYGRIDCLVNNAGIAIDSSFVDKNISDFEKILRTNLIGPFILSRLVAPFMLKEKGGTIINISSTNGIDTYYPESLDYDAAKAGMISLTHNLAKEFAPYIRVNAIAPGWINTDMNSNMSLIFKKQEESKIMLKRFGNPYEVGEIVAFLASDSASYINNTIIRVDGGFDGAN